MKWRLLTRTHAHFFCETRELGTWCIHTSRWIGFRAGTEATDNRQTAGLHMLSDVSRTSHLNLLPQQSHVTSIKFCSGTLVAIMASLLSMSSLVAPKMTLQQPQMHHTIFCGQRQPKHFSFCITLLKIMYTGNGRGKYSEPLTNPVAPKLAMLRLEMLTLLRLRSKTIEWNHSFQPRL
jgi:hypothetical protein